MTFARSGRAAAICASLLSVLPPFAPATAQQVANSGRDCQTVLQCRFTAGGAYRGCISAYTCRTCRTEPARCQVGPGRGRTCHRMVCSWGG